MNTLAILWSSPLVDPCVLCVLSDPLHWRAHTDLCTEPVFIKPICLKYWLWSWFTFKVQVFTDILLVVFKCYVSTARYLLMTIGLSNSYLNIWLTYLSDFNYRTSCIGLLTVRWLSELLQSIGQKMGIFTNVFFHEFFTDLVTFWWISAKINELLPFILCWLRPCLC